MTELIEKIRRIDERIETAALRAGRRKEDVMLVAVTKTHPVGIILEAVDAGLIHLGENRVQEASEKIPDLPRTVTWHLIGHLQRNKVKKALELFNFIHSLDSDRLARIINDRAQEIGIRIPCLVEVNTSGEAAKSGIRPEEAVAFCDRVNRLPGIDLVGLMTVGPFTGEPEDARPCFGKLRNLREEAVGCGLPAGRFRHLSMGMTSDFEIAIEEGATIVRIGSAIFGQRQY